MNKLSAKDLLLLTLEIVSQTSGENTFDVKNIRTPFQVYRYMQTITLMRAMGIGGDISDIISGNFIADRSEKMYAEILIEIRKDLKKYHPEMVTKRKLGLIFQLSFGYAVSLYRVQWYWKTYLIADPSLLFPQIVCKNLNIGIEKSSNRLFRILCLIIDPLELEIPISVLISEYGYPELEVEELSDF